MAKYLAQIVMLGAQVVGRAFTRALRQEFAASQTAANQRRSNNGSNDRIINAKLGMSLQEAIQILNLDNEKLNELSPESILKKYNHLFDVNDKSKGGSFYLQSKKSIQNWKLLDSCLTTRWNSYRILSPIRGKQSNRANGCLSLNQSNGLHSSESVNPFEAALSEDNLQNCIRVLKTISIVRPKKGINWSKRLNPTKAAVLVPFCRNEDREPSVLFTQRSNSLSQHRGEVCFPGGIEESVDNNEVIQTAVRETVEELGVDGSRIRVYGSVNPFPAANGSIVYPVLGFIDLTDFDINSKINREEVENVFVVPLRQLCDRTNWGYTYWKTSGWTTPVFMDKNTNNPRVWGLTAGILYIVLSTLLPKHFEFNYKFLSFDSKHK